MDNYKMSTAGLIKPILMFVILYTKKTKTKASKTQ